MATTVGVAAQNSNTNPRRAAGARVLAAAQTPKVPSPLADAVQQQNKQAVQALLAKKADVNATQADGATALHWATYAEDADLTAQLIRAGAKVNVRNNYGVSPFALAAKQGNANIIGQLMKAGADPNDPLNFVNADETPLMHAARAGSVDAVNALLLAGARVNARENWNGQTPLHWAAAEGHSAVVEALIAGGADIRQRSNAGSTPFMFAVRRGDMAYGRRPSSRQARTSTRSASIWRRRCWSRSSTATKISSTCCSTRAPIRTPRADRPTFRCRARKRVQSKSPSRRRRIAIS